MSETVLVVDDEKDIVDVLRYNLRQAGYRVLTAQDGRSGLESIRRDHPDLVLLDIMLPSLSGLDVLKTVRSEITTRGLPVILLTAKGDEVDRLLGFELGSDDYVAKPFSVRELLLRVRAVLKRREKADPVEEEPGEVYQAGPIEIDMAHHQVRVSGHAVPLTITEFRLLEQLVRANGRVRTRDFLLSNVWGYSSDVYSRTVDTHIRRLREKLGTAADSLVTVRGVGYRLRAAAGEEE